MLKDPIETPVVKKRNRPSRSRHHFVLAALRAPMKIGGFLPSSRSLARAMASGVDLKRAGTVVELGAGTGVVTHALLQAHVPIDRLVVIERDEKLHEVLCGHFPQLNVLCCDVIELDKVLESVGVTKVNTLVSSLPFLVMPDDVRNTIQEQMAKAIGEDGVIVQFTYGPKSPILPAQMRRLHLEGKRMKLVIGNVPPAHVWLYKRVTA
jgi:phosphatidylethanolamine/phosphatidyl-N-methylethanolamine N-methyltransferase